MTTREEILKFSEDFIRTHGYAPTLREIVKATGKQISTVKYHITTLRIDGLIVGDGLKHARAWTLPKFLDAIQQVKP